MIKHGGRGNHRSGGGEWNFPQGETFPQYCFQQAGMVAFYKIQNRSLLSKWYNHRQEFQRVDQKKCLFDHLEQTWGTTVLQGSGPDTFRYVPAQLYLN